MKEPYLFDEFFASGFEESISPFLTKKSKKWSKNLSLKSGLFSLLFLILAFTFSFTSPSTSHFFLLLVYFLSGTPALVACLEDLKNLEINIDVLMTVAAFVAVLIDSSMEGALLLVLFELSHGMEDAVTRKTKAALHGLNNISPKFALVKGSDGVFFEKSVRDIQVKEKVYVKNGEVVPLDGNITEGASSFDLSHLTGESAPVFKKEGEEVPAGAKNLEGAITLEVNRVSGESTLSRIIRLIQEAQNTKPKLERWLDRFGKRYATTIITLTFIFALSFPFLFSLTFLGHEGSVYRSLAFLIAASPCALIIATPTAYLSAMSASAKKGILLKGGTILDALSSCKIIAFDKTGTLTSGKLSCIEMRTLKPGKISEELALQIAYALERQIVHPLGSALCKFAEEKKVSAPPLTSFRAEPGFGLTAKYENATALLGRPEFALKHLDAQEKAEMEKVLQKYREQGNSLALLSIEDAVFVFRFEDEIRKEALSLVQDLKKTRSLLPIMLTGDHAATAKAVGKMLQIEQIYADLSPEEKLQKIQELSEKENLAMIGDGVNDAPALTRASVGISLGQIGSYSAIDASDVILLNDDLSLVSWLFEKAHMTKKIVKQNLTLALSVIVFASLPALLGFIPLWTAVLLHEGGTVLVGSNSLRLLKK